MKNKFVYCFLGLILVFTMGCSKDEDCTRIDRIGGGLLPEQDIEVPCDFPEPKPLGTIFNE